MKPKFSLMVGAALIAASGLGYAAGHANHPNMIAYDDAAWQEIRPGSPVDIIVLWGDPSTGAHGRLLKLPAGWGPPTHAHTADYHGVNLAGTWRHSFDGGEPQDLPPGSYVFQPGAEMHDDTCVGPEDCIIFLHMHEKADFIPREQAASAD
jgi:quercetin dioxygenase-like cupin family protein